ncbi:MAG: hypothetical protein A2351_02315 [Omnitrophica bacterium RIFOXYB12_FULL_50_7]|nr:MAG: hypothetical protein A2351_02315 [Omnitrophica bacterium RIFOXYB12_FULL_50_7]
MKKRFMLYVALLVSVLLLSGCSFFIFDDSDEIVTTDKTISQGDLTRVTSYLLEKVPNIRAEKAKLATGDKKVKLTLSIISSPDPNYTKNDPDYPYHAYYYWVYVSYMTKDRLEKYNTYLVQKDLAGIYRADSETDSFIKVA